MKPVEAARAVGMNEEQFREVNRIPARVLIKAGSTLLVPRGNALLADVSSDVADNAAMMLVADGPTLRKTSLKAGHHDSVASIATRYRVSAAQVAEWNSVSAGAKFAPGQTVIVYVAAKGRKPATAAPTRTASGQAAPTRVATGKAGTTHPGKTETPPHKHVRLAKN
jgi:membrane-bound lytic murein transglycosylase D